MKKSDGKFGGSHDKTLLGEHRHFDAASLGATFQQLAVDVVRGEHTDFMSRWFRSPKSDADLVIWTDSEKRIIKHQLCFFGQIVEWNPINGTRTGLIVEEEIVLSHTAEVGQKPVVRARNAPMRAGRDNPERGGQGLKAEPVELAETIRFDKSAQSGVVDQAMRLLANIPELAPEDRHVLLFNLRESPRLHARARERALKTWAPKVEEIVSTQRPTFWRRLKTWVLGD